MASLNLDISSVELRTQVEAYFSASLSAEETKLLKTLALQWVGKEGLDDKLRIDLRTIIALEELRFGTLIENGMPEGLSDHLVKTIHEAASKPNKRRPFLPTGLRWRIAAAIAGIITLTTVTVRFASETTVDQPHNRNFSMSNPTDTGKTEVGNERSLKLSAQPSNKVLTKNTSKTSDLPQVGQNHPSAIEDYSEHQHVTSLKEDESFETETSERIYLPAAASLPAGNMDDSGFPPSSAIEESNDKIEEIRTLSSRSIARAFLALDNILNDLDIFEPEENNYPTQTF